MPPANLHSINNIISRNSHSKVIRLEWTTLLTNSFYYFHDIFEAPMYPNSSSIRYKLCEYCFEYMHNNKVYDITVNYIFEAFTWYFWIIYFAVIINLFIAHISYSKQNSHNLYLIELLFGWIHRRFKDIMKVIKWIG